MKVFRSAFPGACLAAAFLIAVFQAVAGEPVVSLGTIAADTAWETRYHVVDSGVDGPTVLIVGGMHGNEPAGYRAAAQIRHWPIVKGKLVVIPKANVQALAANARRTPDRPKEESDLNRNFPLAEDSGEPAAAPRGELAMALWKFAGQVRPDWIIDLHEGFEFNLSHNPPDGKKKSVGSSVIYRGGNALDPLAERMADAANATVTDPDKRFALLRRGPVETGLAQACISYLGAEGMILETTYTDQPLSLRTRQHRAMVSVLLQHVGLIDRDCRDLLAGPKRDGHLQIGCFDGVGTGGSRKNLYDVADGASDITLHPLGEADIRPEILRQFDVVIFPGGSGSKQAAAIGEAGREAVREFVAGGGGYVGICAGAYLCSSHYSWSLDLVDSSVFTGAREIPGKGTKQMWYRGKSTDIELELTKSGSALFGDIPLRFDVRYHNGPIISPKAEPDLEDYRVLAWFREEQVLWEPQRGTMIDTPAIVSGRFGEGRVISISPHPESTPALHPIVAQSLRWVAATATAATTADADGAAEARTGRSARQVADALAEHYGHAMQKVSYIPAMALWGRLRLAEFQDEAEAGLAREDVRRIASTAAPATNWSSGSVVAGHLIYGVIGDDDRLLSAASRGLDDDGKARDFFPGHNDMSDAVYMHTPVLAMAHRITGDEVWLEAARNHFAHMKALCLRDDGLYRHSPLHEAAWGRGNGFPALGLALVLSELEPDSTGYAEFLDSHVAHLRALLAHQDADGMWHQVIDHPESYAEFSCTSMIGFAMLRGIREGWLDEAEFGESADRAWEAIKSRIRMDGEFLEGVCTSTGKQTSLQAYFDRKEIHGRDDRGGAMALMFATERMLWERER